ncbi:MAG: hypothetical protein ACR65R_01400 [Methylomicrobium sp.]
MTKQNVNIGKAKRPPYAKSLDTASSGGLLIVCTGSEAWPRAQSTTWFPGCKVVLPPGEDPAAYDWRAAVNHDVIIGGFGELEPIDSIARLGGLLIAAGAHFVIYAPMQAPMMRIEARRAA